jgi:hypothetical protein
MLKPLTHAHEVHRIQTFVSINTISGTQSVPQNDREGTYAYLPTKHTSQVLVTIITKYIGLPKGGAIVAL